MKNLYLCLLLLLGLGTAPAQAQLSGSDSLQAKLTSIFANVDKSQVPTGYLAEAGVRLLEPRFYNGTLTDSNRTDIDLLRYLRLQLRSAYVAGAEALPALPDYNARLDAALAAGGGAIPISMQYMQYNTIRPDALQNNLLSVQNEQVYDVPGRLQNPYRSQYLFAAAPVRALSTTNTISFVLPRNLYLTNSNVPTYAPQVDFGDGRGYQQAAWDQAIGTTYATAGLKRVKVKLSFAYSYGPQESWFDFNVLGVTAAAAKSNSTLSTATCTICDDERPVAPIAGVHSGGTMYIIYGNDGGTKHTQLVKPFIISEGYNLYDIAPELRKCNNPNNTIEEFFDKINRNFLTPNAGNFRTSLLSAGYDIVYVDNARGTDDIVRNAQLFETVVRSVNLMKLGGTATGQKNVVMGQSMGGLVSRYGLAEMTKRGNDDPHTRLLILHDSPQRGAYNPVGVQSLTRSFDVPFLFGNTMADLNGQIRATVRVLNQPATQQLSILNALNGRGGIQANTFVPNSYQPMITFAGQPPYDIVAVSNGSQCGRAQSTPVGVTISQSALAVLLPIPYVGLAGITGDFASYGLPAYGQQATISRVSLRLEYQIRIGYCPFCVTIPIRFNLLQESAQSPANTLPYETLPGGSANPVQQAGSCADGFDFGSLNGIYAAYFRTNLYNGDLCFVPSYSALDVPTVSSYTAYAKYINNITDNPSKPNLSRFIAQENVNSSGTQFNVPHLSFTPRNSEWIFNQMQQNYSQANAVACSTECTALAISSSVSLYQRFCPGTSISFSVNAPAGATVTWSATPTNLFTNTSGSGPSFTTSASGTYGTGTVTATVTAAGACASSASVTVFLGTGEPTGTYSYPGGSYLTLRTVNYVTPGEIRLTMDQPYSFTFTSSDPANVPVYGSGQLAAFTLRAGQGVTIRATSPSGSPCGLAGQFAFTTNGGYHLTATPNPASSDLVVTAVDDDQPETSATPSATAPPFEVELYDNYGKKVKAGKSDKGKAQLDVRELPAGLYNLRAGKGKEAISKHIELTH